MKYKQRFRHATRTPVAFCLRHHRISGWRMKYKDTRRCQQNAMRWMCLWSRKKATHV
jgi:hypothetical protein